MGITLFDLLMVSVFCFAGGFFVALGHVSQRLKDLTKVQTALRASHAILTEWVRQVERDANSLQKVEKELVRREQELARADKPTTH